MFSRLKNVKGTARREEMDEDWRRVPNKDSLGFSIDLKAFPLDGRFVALPPDTDDGNACNGK